MQRIRIKCGMKVKDRLTGLEGIAIGRSEYLTGCVHIGIQQASLTPEGKVRDLEWIDETRLEIVDETIFKLSEPSDPSAEGGPCGNPSGRMC